MRNKDAIMISVIDFGSQYTHLLYQAICKLGYEAKLFKSYEEWVSSYDHTLALSALVLSGGPRSVYEDETNYQALAEWLKKGYPTLGICYGMQLIANLMGGTVEKGEQGEYGNTKVRVCDTDLWSTVWMSHRDHVTHLPAGAEKTIVTENGLIAGFRMGTKDENDNCPIHTLQFHPEVKHTENGLLLLGSALQEMGLGEPNHKEMYWLEEIPSDLDHAICAFSGGVDSLVAATYVHKQIGNRLKCLYIDTGLMRPQDDLHIKKLKESLGLNITVVHAKEQFLAALSGVSEPEAKRKAIGKTFIDVFENELKKLDSRYNYLIQGTIWPDVVESAKTGSGQEVIKSHHNVGGLPENMRLSIYEPLRNFYKTDVRKYGNVLGIKLDYLNRHPFPGPGLGIRIIGEINEDNIRKARESDQILFEELMNTKKEVFRVSAPSHQIPYYKLTWQAFTVVLPIKTVGVKGDSRSYENVVAVRMVNSEDGMTATWSEFSHEFLSRVSTRIMNEVAGVNRVVYDISNKPCATIEWE
jgi:GMP synthase (glutamine-hydrolysing)